MAILSSLSPVALLVLAAVHLILARAPADNYLRLTVVGRTGDGKSSFCNLFMRYFDAGIHNLFPESDDAKSQTGVPLTKDIHNIRLTDTPGLVDTRGFQQDDQNINTIVAHIKRETVNHGFLLVINEQAPRFDKAMQDSVKRLLDSFGDKMLDQLGIVFTKAWHKSERDSRLFVENQIVPMIQELNLNISIPRLPSWQVDCHPEYLASAFNATNEFMQFYHDKNRQQILSILRWLYQNPVMSTLEITAAPYELQKELEEIKEALEEERRQRAEFEMTIEMMNRTALKLVEEIDYSRQDRTLAMAMQVREMLWIVLQTSIVICSTIVLLWTGLAKKVQLVVAWVWAPTGDRGPGSAALSGDRPLKEQLPYSGGNTVGEKRRDGDADRDRPEDPSD